MKNVRIVYKGASESKSGYLKLSVRQDGKTTIQSLDIRVLKKDFNRNTQRIRSSANEKDLDGKTYQEVNEELDKIIYEYSNKPLPHRKIKFICQFIKIVIDETENIGTKEKYENILRLFQNFLKTEYGKNELEIEKINSSVIIKFYQYLRRDKVINNRKSKRNTRSTASYKIKSLKSFFSKLEERSIYKFQVDPFKPLKLKFDDTKKDYLTLEEFNKFLLFEPREFRSNTKRAPILYELQDIKECFVFACLAQGIRISDILTLRINDFEFEHLDYGKELDTLYIHKKMFKTKKNVIIHLNHISIKFIEKQIIRIIETYKPELVEEYLSDFLEYINERNKYEKQGHSIFIQSLIDGSFGTEKYEELKENNNKKILAYSNSVYHKMIDIFRVLNNDLETKTLFIFPFLNNENFENINSENDFGSISKSQYLEYVGKRSYINNLLKKIFKQADINKDYLSFHSARHTYTTLILDNDEVPVNMFDLQKSLGHNSLLSTEKYIRSFNVSKLKNINNGIISRLNLYDNR